MFNYKEEDLNKYYLPTPSYSTTIHYPAELKTVLLDLYLCILEKSPKNIVDFLLEYFIEMKKLCGGIKISFTAEEMFKMENIEQNMLGRRNAISADIFKPKPQHLLRHQQLKRSKQSPGKGRKKSIVSAPRDIVRNDHSSREGSNKKHHDKEKSKTPKVQLAKKAVVVNIREDTDQTSEMMSEKSSAKIKLQEPMSETPIHKKRISVSKPGVKDSRSILSNEDRKVIKRALKKHSIFKYLDESSRREVIGNFSPLITTKGQYITTEGEDGNKCYIVDNGFYSEYREGPGSKEIFLRFFNPGDIFGELAFLYDHKRTTSVISRKKGRLLSLDRYTFKNIILNRRFIEHIDSMSFVYSVPIFQNLTEPECQTLGNMTEARIYRDGIIFKALEFSDGMYLVREGIVELYVYKEMRYKPTYDPLGKEVVEWEKVVLGVVNTGGYFGEMSLISNCIRIAFARARSTVKLLFIDAKKFRSIFASFVETAQWNFEYYEKLSKNTAFFVPVDAQTISEIEATDNKE